MKRVIIESPFAGDVELNRAYALEALKDSLRRGEAPLASHLLYTQVLDDLKPEERQQGMLSGFHWTKVAELVVVYTDRGISGGMEKGILEAEKHGIPVEYRQLFNN